MEKFFHITTANLPALVIECIVWHHHRIIQIFLRNFFIINAKWRKHIRRKIPSIYACKIRNNLGKKSSFWKINAQIVIAIFCIIHIDERLTELGRCKCLIFFCCIQHIHIIFNIFDTINRHHIRRKIFEFNHIVRILRIFSKFKEKFLIIVFIFFAIWLSFENFFG